MSHSEEEAESSHAHTQCHTKKVRGSKGLNGLRGLITSKFKFKVPLRPFSPGSTKLNFCRKTWNAWQDLNKVGLKGNLESIIAFRMYYIYILNPVV